MNEISIVPAVLYINRIEIEIEIRIFPYLSQQQIKSNLIKYLSGKILDQASWLTIWMFFVQQEKINV